MSDQWTGDSITVTYLPCLSDQWTGYSDSHFCYISSLSVSPGTRGLWQPLLLHIFPVCQTTGQGILTVITVTYLPCLSVLGPGDSDSHYCYISSLSVSPGTRGLWQPLLLHIFPVCQSWDQGTLTAITVSYLPQSVRSRARGLWQPLLLHIFSVCLSWAHLVPMLLQQTLKHKPCVPRLPPSHSLNIDHSTNYTHVTGPWVLCMAVRTWILQLPLDIIWLCAFTQCCIIWPIVDLTGGFLSVSTDRSLLQWLLMTLAAKTGTPIRFLIFNPYAAGG